MDTRTPAPESAILSLSTLQSFLDELDDFDSCRTPLPDSHRPEQLAPSPLIATPLIGTCRRRQKLSTGPAPLAPTNTKEGHSQRVRQLLRHIHGLRQQLKHLHVDQRELLDTEATPLESTRRNWKRQAILENCMKTQSMEENRLMRKRLMDGAAMAQSMTKLMRKQIDAIRQLQATTRPPLSPLGVVLQDEDMRIFASIKSRMDARLFDLDSNLRKRLLEITQQCIADGPVMDGQWRITSSNQAVLLSFESSRLLPFNAETANGVICDQVSLNAPEQMVDKIHARHAESNLLAANHTPGVVELGCQSILRRVRSEYGVVLMWESISTWRNAADAEGEPKRAMVCDSGWSIVAPAAGFSTDTSIGHCQKVLRIQSMDDVPLKQEDKLVASIVRQSQKSFTAQGQMMENNLVGRR